MTLRTRPFTQVDVFTAVPYMGNPLAVVLDGTSLSDDAMQRFAHWTNLSETTFVLPPTPEGAAAGADYRVRIFTPGGELPFAGHPTLGTCHAWLAHGGQPRESGVVRQECAVGVVALRQLEGGAIARTDANTGTGTDTGAGANGRMAFAAPPLTRRTPDVTHLAQVLAALGLVPAQVRAAQSLNNGPEWLGLLLDSPDTVLALTPDHAVLKALNQKVGVAALTRSGTAADSAEADSLLIARSSREARAFSHAPVATASPVPPVTPHNDEPDLWVRAFAAPVGVAEDPVTGSLNASLAQWLMADGHLPDHYLATQGQALGRDGQVFLSRDATGQVWVGGDVAPCIQGTVTL
jgi:PhzF family phenazine biosynthesis protein